MALLTSRTLASGVTTSDLIHIVNPNDLSQNPAGSSYKATLGQVLSLFSGTMFTGGSGNCITDFYVTNIHGCSPITIWDKVQSNGSTSTGILSFAFGDSTVASDDYSHAEGFKTSATTMYSHSEGSRTLADGSASHAEGRSTKAIGNFSHAEGNDTMAIGFYSHAEGFQTTANTSNLTSVGYNHSEGYQTLAGAVASHTEGYKTFTNSNYSHAEGSGTTTNGVASHTNGGGTISDGDYQHVSGLFNLTGDTTQGAFIIGNGTDNLNRSNLIFAGGNNVNIYGNLNVTGIINLTGASEFMSTTGTSDSTFTATTGTTYYGSNYAGNTDVYLFDPTGLDGLKFIIKDEIGNASINRIRVYSLSGNIDGTSYVDMNINYMSLTFVARNNNWWII